MWRPCQVALFAVGLYGSAALAQSSGPTNPSEAVRAPLVDGEQQQERNLHRSTGAEPPRRPLSQPGRRALDGLPDSAPPDGPAAPLPDSPLPGSPLPGSPLPGR